MLAELQPHQVAIYQPARRGDQKKVAAYVPYTYLRLSKIAAGYIQELNKHGIAAGQRVAVMVPPSLDFFAVTFALFRMGAVPVFIDPGMGVKPVGRCLREADVQAFIGTAKAHAARVIFGWLQKKNVKRIQIGSGLSFPSTIKLVQHPISENSGFPITKIEDNAAILFTSGSTGAPKGALYTHGNFNEQVNLLQSTYQIARGEIDLCTFPLFALFAPALGMTAVIPEMNFTKPSQVDPEKIYKAIETFGVTNMFGSPALIRRITASGEKRDQRLASLKRVISAGAPVAARILKDFVAVIPENAEIFTPYGATEALPIASIGSRSVLTETAEKTTLGHGICVGNPIRGVKVRIIEISDIPIQQWSESLSLPVNQIGEIVVSGRHVTQSYFGRPEANSAAKIATSDSDANYHRMGDLGFFDDQGRLWFCGRKSQRLSTAVGPMFTVPCESVFNSHIDVYRTALVGLGSPGSMKPVLCVETNAKLPKARQAHLREELLTLGRSRKHTEVISDIRFFDALPVDTRHNGKIFHEKLKVIVDRMGTP